MPPLTAETLKDALWETLQAVKSEKMLPNRADAIAAQAREILRTVKVQMQILAQTKQAVPAEVVAFSGRVLEGAPIRARITSAKSASAKKRRA